MKGLRFVQSHELLEERKFVDCQIVPAGVPYLDKQVRRVVCRRRLTTRTHVEVLAKDALVPSSGDVGDPTLITRYAGVHVGSDRRFHRMCVHPHVFQFIEDRGLNRL